MVQKSVALPIYTFCFLAGLPSNLLACSAFLRKLFRKPTTIDILLLNLTLSDLLCLLFLPFKMMEIATDMSWPLPAFLCPFANFCFYSSIYLSILFLMGISVERYLCVAFPVKYKLNRKPVYAVLASVFFWLLACSHCATVIYVVENHNTTSTAYDNNSTCFETFSRSQLHLLLPLRLEICLVLFCLPFIITCFCYINVVWILTSMPNIPSHKKQRAVALAGVTLLNFVIAFAPYNISHIVGYLKDQSPSWRVGTFFLTSLNTTLDPIIFFFSTSTIQRSFLTACPTLGCSCPPVASSRCLHCYEASKTKDEVGNPPASNLPNSLAAGGNIIVCITHKSTEN